VLEQRLAKRHTEKRFSSSFVTSVVETVARPYIRHRMKLVTVLWSFACLLGGAAIALLVSNALRGDKKVISSDSAGKTGTSSGSALKGKKKSDQVARMVVEPISKDSAYLMGLKNLGNTCFMNSALQALIHSKPFTQWIESIQYSNPVADAFKLVLTESKKSDQPLDRFLPPTVFYEAFKQNCIQATDFGDGAQHDSSEFLTALFACLEHKDLAGIGTPRSPQQVTDQAAIASPQTPLPIQEVVEVLSDRTSNEANSDDGIVVVEDLKDVITVVSDSTAYCLECGYSNSPDKIDLDNIVKVPAADRKSLDDSLENCLKEETLEYNCEYCKVKTTAKKQIIFNTISDLAVISLNRFDIVKDDKGKDVRIKLHDPILFEVSFVIPAKIPGPEVFNLVSVICHSGSADGGHYIAYAKVEGEWYCFDDAAVTKVKSFDPHKLKVDGYILFYEKVKNSIPLLTEH
jgi:ubiquitin C-terminal hydrolase